MKSRPMSEDQKLIRTIARKGFRFLGHGRQDRPASASPSVSPIEQQVAPTLPLPDRPSIAVLPFGETDIAIAHLARTMRLNPLDPTLYHMQAGTGFAHFLAGRFDEACKLAERALREEPDRVPAFALTAAAHALAARSEDAQRAMAHLRAVDPELRVSRFPPRPCSPTRAPRLVARRPSESRTTGMSARPHKGNHPSVGS